MKNKFFPLLTSLFTAAMALTISACNYQVIDLKYSFKKVHVFETAQCYNINSWKDYEGDQIQVDIKEYGTCLFHSNQVVLIENKCPFCE